MNINDLRKRIMPPLAMGDPLDGQVASVMQNRKASEYVTHAELEEAVAGIKQYVRKKIDGSLAKSVKDYVRDNGDIA